MTLQKSTHTALLCALLCLPLAGCGGGPGTPSAAAPLTKEPLHAVSWERLYHVTNAAYLPATHTVRLLAKPAYFGVATHKSIRSVAGENTIDMSDFPGVANMAATRFAGKPVQHVQVFTEVSGRQHLVATIPTFTAVSHLPAPATATPMGASAAGAYNTISVPPPGVQMDLGLTPLAGLSASPAAKAAAVLQIARSKLGTPYIWGHNEDRGQYGFDCSNFTAYVYHHALGYVFSGSSDVQDASVGVPVPRTDLRVGDLLIFENGKHVGIYAGNGKMIEEGGGLGKVGYLSVGAGSYWGSHITSVRQMF
ncbi:MAG: C40 family peptidase [Firmicutes bacterium]|nr:C40 family peptidase [Bacillota bacterium]